MWFQRMTKGWLLYTIFMWAACFAIYAFLFFFVGIQRPTTSPPVAVALVLMGTTSLAMLTGAITAWCTRR